MASGGGRRRPARAPGNGAPAGRGSADPAGPERGATKKERREEARTVREQRKRAAARRRTLRRAGGAAGALVAVVVVAFLVFKVGAASAERFSGDFQAGGTIRQLSLPSLTGAGQVSYARLRDRPMVLNFFASWCPNCRHEMPAFESVYRQIRGRVVFLGVATQDTSSLALAFARRMGVTYPTTIDAQGVFFNATGSSGLPTTLFVLPGGKVAYVQVGALDRQTLVQEIRQYLGVQA